MRAMPRLTFALSSAVAPLFTSSANRGFTHDCAGTMKSFRSPSTTDAANFPAMWTREQFQRRMATLNINVGVLGHVDSGKTSLVRALSTELSTAALDKHPQSQERGITLDLGFSGFFVPAPPHVAGARRRRCGCCEHRQHVVPCVVWWRCVCAERGFERVHFTLVDCPGHAGLIRTIIGGAQIIDMVRGVTRATRVLLPCVSVDGSLCADDSRHRRCQGHSDANRGGVPCCCLAHCTVASRSARACVVVTPVPGHRRDHVGEHGRGAEQGGHVVARQRRAREAGGRAVPSSPPCSCV